LSRVVTVGCRRPCSMAKMVSVEIPASFASPLVVMPFDFLMLYLSYTAFDKETGEEVERIEALPCRRCAEEARGR
jgi:hypothetical protein